MHLFPHGGRGRRTDRTMILAGKAGVGILSRASDEISLADHSAMRTKVSSLPLESNLNDWMAKAVGMRPSPSAEATTANTRFLARVLSMCPLSVDLGGGMKRDRTSRSFARQFERFS